MVSYIRTIQLIIMSIRLIRILSKEPLLKLKFRFLISYRIEQQMLRLMRSSSLMERLSLLLKGFWKIWSSQQNQFLSHSLCVNSVVNLISACLKICIVNLPLKLLKKAFPLINLLTLNFLNNLQMKTEH